MSLMNDVKVLWAADSAGGHVILETAIPAGTYTPEDAARLGADLSAGAKQATDAHAVAAWLAEAGADGDVIRTAVLALREKQRRQDLMDALAPFTRGGLLG